MLRPDKRPLRPERLTRLFEPEAENPTRGSIVRNARKSISAPEYALIFNVTESDTMLVKLGKRMALPAPVADQSVYHDDVVGAICRKAEKAKTAPSVACSPTKLVTPPLAVNVVPGPFASNKI